MPLSKVPKTVSHQREERLERVADMDRRGYTQAAIAKACGVTPALISQDMAVIMNRYRESALADTAARVERACAQLVDVRREAWEGWLRSVQDAVRVTSERAPPLQVTLGKKGKDAKPEPLPSPNEMLRVVKETTVREGQAGDARFLTVIADTIKEEAKLRGLYPDVKSTKPGVDVTVKFAWDDFLDAMNDPDPKVRYTSPDDVNEVIRRAAIPEKGGGT